MSKLVNLEIIKWVYCSFIAAERKLLSTHCCQVGNAYYLFHSSIILTTPTSAPKRANTWFTLSKRKFFYLVPIRVQNATQRPIALSVQLVRLSKKSQNHFCVATLCQSFSCSSCYDLWQSWLLWLSIAFVICYVGKPAIAGYVLQTPT